MRLLFPYAPRYKEAKASAQWNWMLPKKIAHATTSSDLLNAWAFYRHKKKKVYHYSSALRRLVDIGGCNTHDWRYKLITSRLDRCKSRFLNLPRIGVYLGKLQDKEMLERLTPLFLRRLSIYSPQKLSFIVQAHSDALLFDKTLLNRVSQEFAISIPSASTADILRVIESFARLRYYRSDVVLPCISELINRVKSRAVTAPTMSQLVSVLDACGDLRLQPRDLSDLIYVATVKNLSSETVPPPPPINPLLLSKIVLAFDKVGVHESLLNKLALEDMEKRLAFYPPDARVNILSVCAKNHVLSKRTYDFCVRVLRGLADPRIFLHFDDCVKAVETVGTLLQGNNLRHLRVRFPLAPLLDVLAALDVKIGSRVMTHKHKHSSETRNCELGPNLPAAYRVFTQATQYKKEKSDLGHFQSCAVLAEDMSAQVARFEVEDFDNVIQGLHSKISVALDGLTTPDEVEKAYAADLISVFEARLVNKMARAMLNRHEEFTGTALEEYAKILFKTRQLDRDLFVELRGLGRSKGASREGVYEARNREEERIDKLMKTHLVGVRPNSSVEQLFESESKDKKSATKDALPDTQRTVFRQNPRRFK
eukprot:GDKJ01020190.1.p1 GENE.GDKJ01020190.1~~GDKJ01020190.1.p1  ORF type:complete len:629 (+),score=118.33 GDKJ01020190.1:106-1887(+)